MTLCTWVKVALLLWLTYIAVMHVALPWLIVIAAEANGF